MTVVPAQLVAPSRVRLDKSSGSSLGLDRPFFGTCAAFMVRVDQMMGACPPG